MSLCPSCNRLTAEIVGAVGDVIHLRCAYCQTNYTEVRKRDRKSQKLKG